MLLLYLPLLVCVYVNAFLGENRSRPSGKAGPGNLKCAAGSRWQLPLKPTGRSAHPNQPASQPARTNRPISLPKPAGRSSCPNQPAGQPDWHSIGRTGMPHFEFGIKRRKSHKLVSQLTICQFYFRSILVISNSARKDAALGPVLAAKISGM